MAVEGGGEAAMTRRTASFYERISVAFYDSFSIPRTDGGGGGGGDDYDNNIILSSSFPTASL